LGDREDLKTKIFDMELSFTVANKELKSALAHLEKLNASVNKRKGTVLELTLTDGCLALTIPGVTLNVIAYTKGGAKFVLKLWYFADIVKSYTEDELSFVLTEDSLKIKNTIITVHSTFFKDDSILRSIDLPLNYTHVDLLRLDRSDKYTPQEIKFNHLNEKIASARVHLKVDIDDLYDRLRRYGFTKAEISDLLNSKINDGVKTL
jgi:hypothetical protein